MYKKFWLVKIIFGLIPVIVLLFVFGSRSYSQINENQNDTITMRTLHNELDTAGDWVKVTKDQIDNGEEGDDNDNYMDNDCNTDYVWVPHYNVIDPDWNPYCNGQWIWADFGWTWVSYYNWGWLPYHYGRWWYSPIWGWVWSPGYTWAPCWVDWYWGYGYVGWYPISPRHHWRWNHGCVVTNNHIWPREKNYRKWTFVKEEDFNKKISKSKLANVKENKEIFADTKTNQKLFEKGPNVKDLEKITGEKITAKKIVLASDNKKITYDAKTFKNRNNDNANKKVMKTNTDPVKKNPDIRNPNNKVNDKSVIKKSSRHSNNDSNKGSYNNRRSNNSNNSSKGNNNGSYRSGNNGNHNNSGNTRSSNSGSHNRSGNTKSSNNGNSNNSGNRR